MYHFSNTDSHEFFGRKFYGIIDESGETVAYSECIFDINHKVYFSGGAKIFASAVILGGVIRGGVIRGGVILGGVILGGEILGGVIWGGEILGGVIRGGVIRGGEILGGVIRGGVYVKTLLQIQGSRHFCYATPTDRGDIELGIGCKIYPICEWQKNYLEIGRDEDYTEAEVEEYGEYIALFAKRYGL